MSSLFHLYGDVLIYIVDDTVSTPDHKVYSDNLTDDISRIMTVLNPKEKDVISMRYGLYKDGERKTLEEIAHMYGISRERVRQIENKALFKLKKCINKETNPKLKENLKNYF